MSSTQLAIFALVLGLVIGAAVTVALVVALRARDRHLREVAGDVPEGITAVLAGMDDAAAVLDTSFQLLATSTAAGWLGFETGRPLENPDLRALVRRARSAGGTETETLRIRLGELSPELRLVSARATVLSARLTMLTVRDISESERLEQMRHDFVSNTSHELKTPVGAITLLSEAVDMAADDPDQVRVFAARLQAEARRLGGLTGRIMSLSKLQSTDGLSEVRDVSVDEVVAAAVDANSVAAQGANVELLRGGERGLFVRGDAQILSDALGNLVSNAVKYSTPGSRVGIGVKRVDDVIEIAVADQGIGIAEDDQQRIFERFYRADQARSRSTGGTGLGLSIVKHAVQRHGGDVRLWSRPGKGATFTIVLPASESPVHDKARKVDKPRKPEKARKSEEARKAEKLRKKQKREDRRRSEELATETAPLAPAVEAPIPAPVPIAAEHREPVADAAPAARDADARVDVRASAPVPVPAPTETQNGENPS
jgi:two-component system sensor histidine kinase SenX3